MTVCAFLTCKNATNSCNKSMGTTFHRFCNQREKSKTTALRKELSNDIKIVQKEPREYGNRYTLALKGNNSSKIAEEEESVDLDCDGRTRSERTRPNLASGDKLVDRDGRQKELEARTSGGQGSIWAVEPSKKKNSSKITFKYADPKMGQQKNGSTKIHRPEKPYQNGKDAEEKKSNGFFGKKFHDPMIEGVRWTEKYDEKLSKIWAHLPDALGKLAATLAIFTFGATLKGEWVIMGVAAFRQWTGAYSLNEAGRENLTLSEMLSLENLKMNGFFGFWIGANLVSYGMYFLIGGFLHWYFYVKRRHLAHEWKLQPNKWLSPELELHEIMVGTISLFVTGSYSAVLACYIYNGNPSTIYYQFDEYGWLWFILQFPVIFIYQDYTTYLLHRLYHTPFLYKHFHKLHHKYKQPTAFSVTAIHPVEIMHIQLTMCLPLFTIPVHWLAFYVVAVYTYYHGIIDHSGIYFKAFWWQPWQPDSRFHDLHHEFFHINFAFNIKFWDAIHGTQIKEGKTYTEETFFQAS